MPPPGMTVLANLPVLEKLLRTMRRDPAKLAGLHPLVSDLADDGALPPGFAELWATIYDVATPRSRSPVTAQHIDVEAVLADLKDFQRRTARWAFERMFAEGDPATRFLVADEVGLGKTHVAKGVIAQVIDHLRRTGDARLGIVYVCSNAAIARQNVRKLVSEGIQPLEGVERLTMLPLADLDRGDGPQTGVNLLPITPGTSLTFGRNTGKFEERCLAYTFLRAHWGSSVTTAPARRIFWHGIWVDPDERLCWLEQQYRSRIEGSLGAFADLLAGVERVRSADGRPTLRELFEELVDGLALKRTFPEDLLKPRKELIGEVRRIMATVGIAALQPDLVVLDEFQRFKDLLQPDPTNFAAEMAHRLFNHKDPKTGRATRTLLPLCDPVSHVHNRRRNRWRPLRGLPRHLLVPASGLSTS